jgi:hypothetical protein
MSQFQKHSAWETPDKKRVLLLEKKIESFDSVWLGLILPMETSSSLPAKFEKCICAESYLLRCKFIEQLPAETKLLIP